MPSSSFTSSTMTLIDCFPSPSERDDHHGAFIVCHSPKKPSRPLSSPSIPGYPTPFDSLTFRAADVDSGDTPEDVDVDITKAEIKIESDGKPNVGRRKESGYESGKPPWLSSSRSTEVQASGSFSNSDFYDQETVKMKDFFNMMKSVSGARRREPRPIPPPYPLSSEGFHHGIESQKRDGNARGDEKKDDNKENRTVNRDIQSGGRFLPGGRRASFADIFVLPDEDAHKEERDKGPYLAKRNRMGSGSGDYLPPPPTTPTNTTSNDSGNAGTSNFSGSYSSLYPSLHLTPLNDTFVPKQISLSPPGTRIKIGRQTNAKTVPSERNGYFDSKVLSRMHAEIWSDEGKVYIKDVKSSNGTFINRERLSPEGVESDISELHTNDIVEFGIDIISDDTRTIVHHKVAAKVFLVMNAEDALASSKDLSNWFRSVGESPMHRRPKTGGGSALSFEHVMNRLQAELQKSRDTAQDLGGITSTMGKVHDTLNGGASAPPPISPNALPPFPPQMQGNNNNNPQTLSSLQAQLTDTRASLASHTERMRNLEAMVSEHEVLKREVGEMRSMVEHNNSERESESERLREAQEKERGDGGGRVTPVSKMLEQEDEGDARTDANMETVRGLKLSFNKAEDGFPPTSPSGPEGGRLGPHIPNGIIQEEEQDTPDATAARIEEVANQLQQQNKDLSARIDALSCQLEEATKFTVALQSHNRVASSTIQVLEEKVRGLEDEGERWQGWRTKFEEDWKKDRQGWEEEHEKLKKFMEGWETKQRKKEGGRRRQLEKGSSSSEDDNDGSSSLDELEKRAPGAIPKSIRSKAPKSRRHHRSISFSLKKENTSNSPSADRDGSVVSNSEGGLASGGGTCGESESQTSSGRVLGVVENFDIPTSPSFESLHPGKEAGCARDSWGVPADYLRAAGAVAMGFGLWAIVNKIKN